MGRRVTWLVVGAVAAVAVAATVEALLGEPEARSTSSREPGLSATIDGGERLRGVLYYTDPTCVLRGLRLPELHPAPAPEWQECTFPLRQVTVKAHAWLDDARLVLIVALDVLAAGRFEQVVVGGRRAIAVVPVSGGRLSALRASPRGRYFTVRAEDPDAVLLFDRDGNALEHPSLTRAHALSWSPGERWTAVATEDAVEIWRTTAPNLPVRHLGIRAGDLAWRLGVAR